MRVVPLSTLIATLAVWTILDAVCLVFHWWPSVITPASIFDRTLFGGAVIAVSWFNFGRKDAP